MKKPFFDKTKLPEAMKFISEANSLMTEKDCENDEAVKKELEELQNKLREITGKPQILIKDFWRYDAVTDLETIARCALMCTPEKEGLTDEQLKETVLNIMNYDDEAEMDWWIKYLEVNTGLDNLTDYIFYPDLIGLDEDSSLEQIADKIIEDRKLKFS